MKKTKKPKKEQPTYTLEIDPDGLFAFNAYHFSKEEISLFLNLLGFEFRGNSITNPKAFHKVVCEMLDQAITEDEYEFRRLFSFYADMKHWEHRPILAKIVSNFWKRNAAVVV